MKTSEINKRYDLVIAGGGITGAGIFLKAAEKGYRVLLVEAEDFAWGTSSRSSKMVHGGLRYLKQGKFLLTKTAVKERERLLERYPGLVTPLKFVMPLFDHYGPSKSSMKLGLSIYSFMAKEKQHKTYSKDEMLQKVPEIRNENLIAAVGFKDAQVDDARLVLRQIHDGCRLGGTALNYTALEGFHRDEKGYLSSVDIKKKSSPSAINVKTTVLINATGAFAETLHPSPKKGFHIRPLRGSHLVFPKDVFPLDCVISFMHPEDLRPVFIVPWEGSVFLGTTDVDHDHSLTSEPYMTLDEATYLIEGLNYILPGLNLTLNDSISSFAGIRPVLSKRKKQASQESREHVIWKNKGLITVTGGKLTTFQMLAKDALAASKSYLPEPAYEKAVKRKPDNTIDRTGLNLPEGIKKRLLGRYGVWGVKIISHYDKGLLTPIENTRTLWAELCFAAEHETIVHLSDLLLRRVRIGLLLPDGGTHLLGDIEKCCAPYLPWDRKRWKQEKEAYDTLWKTYYSPPSKRKGTSA